ncbi:bifunctional adenosylcobinamide kinase/adenosylcobinamide-phosphate guanylyltransferase [Acidocella sp.]|jgi:adenosylcobinamide kinase/adenosylcobinamide-phosphate guanylyltransferase|uniref:bifunctional adenosylcobinamide kinase/adenosylcobinamide-phosphate guanylyltransferase n=1 Tax=Acidocella sp. TaxID=50710 RepID=UPI002F403F25
MALTLVLGGARSGKSGFAQAKAEVQAEAHGLPAGRLVMIVTGQAFDDEMRQRIEQHRRERGDAWRTVEAPLDLPQALESVGADDVVVVDCLTLWLSNLMLAGQDVATETDALLATLRRTKNPVWLVSNEVGLGIVPENALARRFRDEAGRLHRQLAAQADHVVLMVAGLPLKVK